MYNHPEFGILPEHAPDEACVEILDKRTAHERTFVNITDSSKKYIQQSYGIINEWKDGYWISVRNNIQATQNGIFENRSQTSQVILNTIKRNTTFKEANRQLFFNNWILLVKKENKIIQSLAANWSHYSVGDNGIFIQNIFAGIDAEIIILNGKVKTNFIIRRNELGVFDELVFRDRYKSTKALTFAFENETQNSSGIDNIIGYEGEQAVVEIGMAHAYIDEKMESSLTTLPYSIQGTNIDLIVPYDWMIKNLQQGSVIIDPMVTSTATKAQSSITGSKYGATCFTEYCSYTMSLTPPLSSTITDLKFTFNYLAASPCAVKDGGFSIHHSTCRSPAIAGVHYCNLPSSGICNGENISIYTNMDECLSPMYCTPTALDFELRFYRCVQSTTGCSGTCVGAASDWILTLYASSLEKTPPTLSASEVCVGETLEGNISYSLGAVPYTHVWSLSPDGSSPLATGDHVFFSLSEPGYTKVYVKTTDGCGISYLDSVFVTVNPTYNNIVYDTVCQMELPIIWHGITVYYGGPYAAVDAHTTSAGCDSNTILNLHVINTLSSVETISICPSMLPYTWNGKTVSAGGFGAARDTTISSVTGCDSITTLNLVVTPTITVIDVVHICSDELPYTWNGFTVSAGGAAVATYATTSVVSGCDSVTTLNLVVHSPVTIPITQHFCHGGYYIFGGDTLTSSGAYSHTFTSIYGCDSTINLTLIENPIDTIPSTSYKCRLGTYTFYGSTLTSAGTYFHLDTSGTCDIVHKLTLLDYDTIYTYDWLSVCEGDPLVWGGDTFDVSGILTFVGVNASGCDTMHTINLTVIPPDTTALHVTICPLDTYYFYDTPIYLEGEYFHSEIIGGCTYTDRLILSYETDTLSSYDWTYICSGGSVSYGDTTIYDEGTYNFYGVNAGGCDTVFTLYVYVDPPTYEYQYETICNGQSISFFDSTYTSEGTYYHYSSSGCDTTWVLSLTVIDTIRSSSYESICEGNVFTWQGVNYDSNGDYYLSGTTAAGCDTAFTLHLTVIPADTITLNDTICPEATYDFFGMDLSAGDGIYIHRDTIGVCDTIYKLILTVQDTITTSYTNTFCAGTSYTWKGVTYATSGIYSLFGINDIGCDTLHTLNLTFLPPDTLATQDTICSGNTFYFYGSSLGSTGTYYYTTMSSGCEQTYQLDLWVNDTIRTVSFDTICSGTYIEFAGSYLTSTGAYYYYGANAAGCDTLRTFNLYVNPPYLDTTYATICPGESYNFYGIEYSVAGSYTYSSIAEGCDTSYILILNIPEIPNLHDTFNICAGNSIFHDGVEMNTTGVYPFYYTSVDGCDSNYTITLNVTPWIDKIIDTTICDNEVYFFFDSLIYIPGTYYHLIDYPDCDTMYILNLEHNPTYRQVQNIVLCNNELPYTHLGITIPYGSGSNPLYDSVMFTSSKGCDSLIVIDVLIKDTSRTDLDTTVCYGTVFNFGSNTISSAGVYFQTLTNAVACDSVVALHVEYTPKPSEKDTFISGCSTVVYFDSVYFSSVKYTDTFRNAIGCDSFYRHIDIEVLYQPYDTLNVAICEGQSYLFNGKTYSIPTVVTDSFVYDNGCDSFITLVLTVNPLPDIKITATSDEEMSCVLDSVLLTVSGATHYQILNGVYKILGENTEILAILPKKENRFVVIGQNEFGCVDSTSITVLAEVCCDALIPNAFSPNNDGINDFFGPVTFGTPENYRFQVFNRWGELVFVSFKVEDKWNGKYDDGKDADAGVYFYIMTGKCFDGRQLQFKGDVTLIR